MIDYMTRHSYFCYTGNSVAHNLTPRAIHDMWDTAMHKAAHFEKAMSRNK